MAARTRMLVYTATDACNNTAFTQVITWTVPDNSPVLSIDPGSNVVISWPITRLPFRSRQPA
jgi:hypothetical protein